MRLIDPDTFADVFVPLQGKRIGYVRPLGNVGDALIEQATLQLFETFGIAWRPIDPDAPGDVAVDELVFGGGGNMGRRYLNNWLLRGKALTLGLPMTILPQTFTSPEERPYRRVYVRERASLAFCGTATLAPELALGLDCPAPKAPTRGTGVFLRRDRERTGWLRWFRRDPVKLCRTPQEYLELAADHERIVTDRLHFAIAGLLCRREVTLLANDYHKNRSMHETWLKALGCRFAACVREALGPRFFRWLPSHRLKARAG
ncbi:MAG: polysaccharide pyruvyl transferase family protein [Pirellulales bacterium]